MKPANTASCHFVRSSYNEQLLQKACRDALAELGHAPSFVIAHFSSNWLPHFDDAIETIRIYGHAIHVIGSTGSGLISGPEETENASGCSLFFLSAPTAQLDFVEISPIHVEDFTLPDPAPGDSWITFCNPYLFHAEEWMQRWNSVSKQAATFGGLASSASGEDGTRVFHNLSKRDLACVGVRIRGGIHLKGIVSQGCRPIGAPYTITEVDENVLVTLGSRKAFEVLEEAFESLSRNEKAKASGNIFAGLALNEYREAHDRGDFLVRNILAGDPQAGVLAVGAFPRRGQTLQFQIRDEAAAHEDLAKLCKSARQKFGQPFGGMLFSCTGRGRRMFGTPSHDASVLHETFGAIPLAGFFGNGEIGPVCGTNFLHGYTASAVLFYEDDC